MSTTNIITATFGSSQLVFVAPQYQYNYGQILYFSDLDLPTSYEVHFANASDSTSVTQIGDSDGVTIPDTYFTSGETIRAWVFLHADTDDGETMYEVRIPIISRAEPSDDEPTPEEQSAITQAIAALNTAVTACETAQEAIEDMTVSSETLAEGSTATVTKTTQDGVVNLEFGIPVGATGNTGNGIASAVLNADYTLTITFTDGTSYTTESIQGEHGDTGNGISSIAKTSTSGLVDTYTVTFTDGTTTTFTVTNGDDGVSPTVTVTEITGGHNVSITDAYSTQSFDVLDGNDYVLTDSDKEDIADLLIEHTYDAYIEKTASGSTVTFADGADDIPVKSLTVDVNPVQDLHGYDHPWVGGCGKNLFNPNSTGTEWVTNAGVISSSSISKSVRVNVTSGQALTLSNANASSSTNVLVIAYFDNENTMLTRNVAYSGATYVTGTAPENTSFAIAVFYTWSEVSNAQLELGSTATAYEPYENVCPITGWTGVNITKCGINIWDEEWEVGDISLTTGENASASTVIRSKNYIPVLPNTDYYFRIGNGDSASTVRARFYDKNKNFIGIESANSSRAVGYNKVFTTPSNCYYMRFSPQISYGSTYNDDISINYPSTDTNYHAYDGQNITVDWTSEAGTVYGGTLDVLTGVLTVDKAVMPLNSTNYPTSEYGSGSGIFFKSGAFVAQGYPAPNYNVTPTCSHYKCRVGSGVSSGELGISGGYTGYCIKDDVNGATLTDLQNYIVEQYNNGTPVTILYELATPTTYQLTPQEVRTLLHNTIYADTGNVSVTYRADPKTYIDDGDKVSDVQIDGNSILSDGVANIPIAKDGVLGAVKPNSTYGTVMLGNAPKSLGLARATDAEIKDESNQFKPIVPNSQHRATFYGLAKASGDTTQSASSNAVGTYTEDAKSSISEMLNAPVSVSGTTPTIDAKSGVRYICGEVATLDITVPSSGIIDVIFESGSTATVLTVTPPSGMTMKWANGFDPTTLDANTIYEVNIMDGCYGAVMSWT